MQFRALGNTGEKVSILGFGASPLGGVFRAMDESDGIRTVHAAIALGVNYFDVSPFYGATRAETVLGKGLAGIPRDKYLLSTKVGRYGQADFDFSAARATRSIDESLSRLGLNHIDLILCHDIEFGSLQQVIHETLPALRKAVSQGKARFIGITGLPLPIFPAVIDHAKVDVILSYCHYALNDTSLTQLLPYLQERNIGVISASPFSMGLLTETGAPAWHPAPPEIKARCAEAAAFCRSRGVDISKLAIQMAVARPEIATTLAGIGSVSDLERNARWIAEPIDAQLLAEVQKILQPIHNQTWPSGLPENN